MHRTTIAVRWAELDPYHHVNHATYLSYFEHARIAALDEIGWDMVTLEAAGFRVVVVRLDVRFRKPATGGDRLEVVSAVTHVGASASTWSQALVRDGDTLVEATIEAACTDLDGRPVRMPEGLSASLTSLTAEAG
jgi:YbgC/YbaW family acyl-CoA thioester hydrolase